MLALIVLILLGVAVIAVATVGVLRSPVIKQRQVRYLDPERVESEVYEKIYGKPLGNRVRPVAQEPAT